MTAEATGEGRAQVVAESSTCCWELGFYPERLGNLGRVFSWE